MQRIEIITRLGLSPQTECSAAEELRTVSVEVFPGCSATRREKFFLIFLQKKSVGSGRRPQPATDRLLSHRAERPRLPDQNDRDRLAEVVWSVHDVSLRPAVGVRLRDISAVIGGLLE